MPRRGPRDADPFYAWFAPVAMVIVGAGILALGVLTVDYAFLLFGGILAATGLAVVVWYAFRGTGAKHGRLVEDRRKAGVAGFIGSLALLGLGIAIIDQIQGIEGAMGMGAASSPLYYYGFGIAIGGLIAFFLAIDTIHFHPIWLFAVAVFAEIYGWWNIWWSVIDYGYCGGCHLPLSNGVGLILLPQPIGEVFIPIWLFFLTSALAVLVPVFIAALAPRDVQGTCPS